MQQPARDKAKAHLSCYRVAGFYSYIEWGGADGQKNVFFKDLMAFDMFALALLTFFFTFLK